MLKTTNKRRTVRRRLATADRGRPASDFSLTAEERAMLPDPNQVTEDDADAIIGRRRERTEKSVPLDKVLKRHGRVEG